MSGLYDNFATAPSGAASNSIYSTGVAAGVISATEFGLNSDDELEEQFAEQTSRLDRKATVIPGNIDTEKSEEFGWGTGTIANNSIKMTKGKKGKRNSKARATSAAEEEISNLEQSFSGFEVETPEVSASEPNRRRSSNFERSSSITITKKNVSMKDKQKLLQQAMGKSMKTSNSVPKATVPDVPDNLQEQFLTNLSGARSTMAESTASPRLREMSSDERADGHGAQDAPDLPPRKAMPTLVSDSPVDVYIAYMENDDEEVARKLASKLELEVVTKDDRDLKVFFDKVSMSHMWIKGQAKWRKAAGNERLKELISARRYIVLVSEAAVDALESAHEENNVLSVEMQEALNSSRPVVPIFLGHSGKPFRGVNLKTLATATAFNEYCTESPRGLMKRLLERPCLRAKYGLNNDELEESAYAIQELIKKEYLELDSGKSFITEEIFQSAKRTGTIKKAPEKAPSPVPSPEPSDSEDDNEFSGDPELIKWGHWQLDRQQVEIIAKIGEGEFGEVSKGKLHGTGNHEGMVANVAIKQLKGGSKPDAKKEFLREAQFMVQLHQSNLVNIYGVCTIDEPVLIVSELCEGGALKNYLPNNKYSGVVSRPLMIKFMVDVCRGMEHIEGEGFIHRDLAARNVLVEIVGDNIKCKVADFGLAVKADKGKNFYQGDITQPVPIRWTAPEAVRRGEFSNFSDVWSYGIVLYEIVTFGGDPYDGVSNKEVVEQVCDGNVRLPCPKDPRAPIGCPEECHEIMLNCWAKYPEDRPSFGDLVPEVEALERLPWCTA